MDKVDTPEPVPVLLRPGMLDSQSVLCLRGGGIRAGLPATNKHCSLHRGCQFIKQKLFLRLLGPEGVLQEEEAFTGKTRVIPGVPQRLQGRDRILQGTSLA